MNYGIDNDYDIYLTFTEDDLKQYNDLGITYRRDGDKTFLVSYDDKLIGVIDNNATKYELNTILNNSFYSNLVSPNNENIQDGLGDFVRTIEQKTGKTIDFAGLEGNNYKVVVEGETILFPYDENKTLGVDEVISQVGTKQTVQASDKLNDSNKAVIEEFLKESLQTDAKVEIKLNEKGVYSVYLDGNEYIEIGNDVTLSETVATINKAITTNQTLGNYSAKNYETYNVQARTNQLYKVYVDTNLFDEVLKKHNNAKEEIDNVKTLYKTDMMTNELLDAYNELVEAEGNVDPRNRIDKTVELLTNITLSVKYSLEAYKNIDHNLGSIFNSVVNDIFKINSYKNEEINNFEKQTIDERVTEIDNLINSYKDTLKELKEEFKGLYSQSSDGSIGVKIDSEETYVILDTLISCFVDNTGGTDIDNQFNIMQIQNFLEFSKNNKLPDKLDSYFDGNSWQVSGMSELNNILYKKMMSQSGQATESLYDLDALYEKALTFVDDTTMLKQLLKDGRVKEINSNGNIYYEYENDSEDDYIYGRDKKIYGYKDGNYYFNNDYDLLTYMLDKNIDNKCEQSFLKQFYNNAQMNNLGNNYNNINFNLQSSGLSDLEQFDILVKGENEISEKDCLYLKKCMGDIYQKNFSYTTRDGETNTYNLEDYCMTRMDECNTYLKDISLMNETIYQLKQYGAILPYEMEMENLDYLDYLVKDYSKMEPDDIVNENNIKYLSQEELALYDYFKNNNPDKAAPYIKALQDTINQRKGYEDAALRIYNASQNGEDVIDILTMGAYGFSDGCENFIQGLGDFFTGIDKCLGLNLISDDTYGEIRTDSDYRNMYMMSLLQGDNVYNSQLSEAFREILKVDYTANSSLGNMAIPTLVSLVIPGVGSTMSSILLGASAAGNTMRNSLLENDKYSDNKGLFGMGRNITSLLYGIYSGCSEALLEKMFGGILGLNGDTKALSGIDDLLKSMGKEAKEEFFQTYLDGFIKSLVYQEPLDLTGLTGEAVESGLYALYTSGALNTVSSCLIKVEDQLISISPSQFNSYSELDSYVKKQLKIKQDLVTIDYKKSREMGASLGIVLKDGDSLVYNPNTDSFQKVDAKGHIFNIPNKVIGDYEVSIDDNGSGVLLADSTNYVNELLSIPEERKKLFQSMVDLFSTKGELDPNVRVEYTEEQIKQMRDDILNWSDKEDDIKVLTSLVNTLEKQMRRGNPNTWEYYKTVMKLLNIEIELHDDNAGDEVKKFWGFGLVHNYNGYNGDGSILIDDLLDINLIERIIIHEMSHAMQNLMDYDHVTVSGPCFYLNSHSLEFSEDTGGYILKIGDKVFNYSEIMENVRVNLSKEENRQFLNYIYNEYEKAQNQYVRDELAKEGKTLEDAYDEQFEEFKAQVNSTELSENLTNALKDLNLNPDDANVSEVDLYSAAIIAVMDKFKDISDGINDKFTMLRSFGDMVSSAFGGAQDFNINGKHSEKYYGGTNLHSPDNAKGLVHQFNESFAQIIPLMQLSPQSMEVLYKLFGQEYMDMMMAEVNQVYSK